jgi:hypothetical protein
MIKLIKKNVFAVLTVGLLLGLNSCCTKMKCEDVNSIFTIEFYGFSLTELDTIEIYSYSKNSTFTILVDSSVTQAQLYSGYYYAYPDSNPKIDLDHKIKIISTGQIFTLTDFEIEKKGCNKCFPSRPKGDFYNELKGYSVNGQKQSGYKIKIYK